MKEIPVGAELTAEELISWAINENNGNLSTHVAENHFATRTEQATLRSLLQEMEGKIYTIDEIDYKIIPPMGGSRGRKVVKVELTPTVEPNTVSVETEAIE